jgi:DNA-binding Lrp family transcriptional regulator
MSYLMKIDDEVRLNVLEALLNPRAVSPNLEQIKKITGYHKATIKGSIEFLKKEGVLKGFGPKVDIKEFGFGLEVKTMLQADISKKKILDLFFEKVKTDPHVYQATGMIGSGNWNLALSSLYRDVESFHKHFSKNYFESVPDLFDLIKDKQVFYFTEPFYKMSSRTESIIKIIRFERGID